jgi:predicted 3-demethylubiquinone-9 3-methyltransferase (glyoxalase superfamily)
MQKITPFLWFDDKAEEAANFYVSIFKNSRILAVNRWGRRRDVETGGG